MRRRTFITLLGSAVAWPLAARAQQSDRVRRIAALMNLTAEEPEGQARNAAFVQGFQHLGWIVGRNLRIDYRWVGSNTDRVREYGAELVALAPEVVLATSSPSVVAVRQASSSVPMVFVQVADPIGAGFVESLARPGGNGIVSSLASHFDRERLAEHRLCRSGRGRFHPMSSGQLCGRC